MRIKILPTFNIEDGLLLPDDALIAGVDEVGRGSLAGPVMAAAIILDRSKCWGDQLDQVDDSKLLSKKNVKQYQPGFIRCQILVLVLLIERKLIS